MINFGRRYYVLIFILALALGLSLRALEKDSFKVVKNSTAYAPEIEFLRDEDVGALKEKININTASNDELDKLYGIGEGLAKRIVEYRIKNGKFEVIQDIMKVNGIGQNTFDEIKNDICVK